MSNNINKNILDSLSILGLSEKTTKEQILTRTKKLQSVYEDSHTIEDVEKLAQIYQASNILLSNFEIIDSRNKDYIENNGQTNPNIDSSLQSIISEENEFKKNENSNKSFLKKNKKKKTVIFGCVALLSIVIAAIWIPLHIKNKREYDYHILRESMMEVSDYFHLYDIYLKILNLPDNFRDIDEIEAQYQLINSLVNTLRGDLLVDFENMKTAFDELVLIDETFLSWNLSSYLDSVDRRVLYYDTYWRTFGGTYSFQIYTDPEDDNQWFVSTDIPYNGRSGASYSITVSENGTLYQYKNNNDEADIFYAYKITSIKEEEIKIYCYKNRITYTLTP